MSKSSVIIAIKTSKGFSLSRPLNLFFFFFSFPSFFINYEAIFQRGDFFFLSPFLEVYTRMYLQVLAVVIKGGEKTPPPFKFDKI